jgi:8-oxo-dGTP pyrophosphatase MutT (NUDIX family)
VASGRGGEQRIPRPPEVKAGSPAPWAELTEGERAVTVAQVRRAVAGAPEGRPIAAPLPSARAAAVLVPVFEEHGVARLVLTRRASHLPSHQGEIAFPGGKLHPGESAEHGALREAFEEVGIEPADVEIVGDLDDLATVAGRFVLSPIVGVLAKRPVLTPDPGEVARVFDVSFADLLDGDTYHEERWELPGIGERPMYFFELEGETVWGATARILHELLVMVTGTRVGER